MEGTMDILFIGLIAVLTILSLGLIKLCVKLGGDS